MYSDNCLLLDKEMGCLVDRHVIHRVNNVENNKKRRKHTSGYLVDGPYSVHVFRVGSSVTAERLPLLKTLLM